MQDSLANYVNQWLSPQILAIQIHAVMEVHVIQLVLVLYVLAVQDLLVSYVT